MKTTNYYNVFIEVAEDCPTDVAEPPPERKQKTKVRAQFETISNHPYEFTSDDVIFAVYAERKEIPEDQREAEREQFFSKGRACLRSSSLGKRYGWGIHSDGEGKVALYPVESNKYDSFANNPGIKHLRAMRSSRK